MVTQAERAQAFAKLHVKGDPIVLFNIWDAGSARTVQAAGAKAIATGSHSVAEAHGYADGENLPFDLVVANAARITSAVDLPVTIDLEGGYAREAQPLQQNVARIIEAGAIGINFEDQFVGGEGLYTTVEQAERIAAIRQLAEQHAVPLFINARTDIFLKLRPAEHAQRHVDEAVERAAAYADAGASGFFAPGLIDRALIENLCSRVSLPVNIMFRPDNWTPAELADLGVARISYGGYPYIMMQDALKSQAVVAARQT